MRLLLYGLVLVAVGVAPYLWSQWEASRATAADGSASTGTASNSTAPIPGSAVGLTSTGQLAPALGGPQANSPRADAPPIVDVAEAIRFEVTPSWLFQRWPRVTAGLPEGDLQGYRVPLVTGAREDDIAGSLTYYFNAQQVCRKITLVGSTGDPRKIAGYVSSRFGLRRQSGADPAVLLFQTRWNGKAVSELRIKTVPVVKSTQPLARFEVQLVLNSWSR